MPHILIKLVPGKTEQQKNELTAAITSSMTSIFKINEDLISIAFEEVQPKDWTDKVYKPDIQDKWDTLLKKPGYNPL